MIMSEFVWGTNLDEATNDIRDRIGQIKKYLPSGIADPIIIKVNTSEFPVAFMTVYGNRSLYELQKLTEDVIQPRLERVDGSCRYNADGR